MLLGLMALVTVVMHVVSSQERGSNVLRQGGSKHVQSEIITSRTQASLSCESGDMVVSVNFTEPFKGLMYAHRSRTSPCRVNGKGGYFYRLRIPLKGCGTWQEYPRVFINNITIRFHPALELEEDETKTVVCRYPPPLTPPPKGIHIITPVTSRPNGAIRVRNAGISEVEILIIICLLLFFSLLTVGIGIAYFCLRRKNIHLIRRKTISSSPGSQLTKLSTTPLQSSVMSSSILDHIVRIPRAIPYSASIRANTTSDHVYEQDDESSGSPGVSRDSLESSPTTTTTSGGSADGADWYQRTMARSKTFMTIPKAILRRDEEKRRVMLRQQLSGYSTKPSIKTDRSEELEDQTVTTLLDPEYSDNGNHQNGNKNLDTIPVYAKVEKKKQRVRIVEGAQIMNARANSTVATDFSTNGHRAAYESLKRKEMVIDKNGIKLLDEIISGASTGNFKNNLSSVALDRSAMKSEKTSQVPKKQSDVRTLQHGDDYVIEQLPPHHQKQISTHSAHVQSDSDFHILSDEKKIYIHDISDVYVTTTVETESTEIRTKVTRDVIEDHVKDSKLINSPLDRVQSETKDHLDSLDMPKSLSKNHITHSLPEYAEISEKANDIRPFSSLAEYKDTEFTSKSGSVKPSEILQPKTENWNVIIRQKKPPKLDTLSPDIKDEAHSSKPSLQFDIKFRTISPPNTTFSEKDNITDRRDSTELVDVPKLEIPHSIEKLRSVMAQLNSKMSSDKVSEKDSDDKDSIKDDDRRDSKDSVSQAKTVWWSDDLDPLVSKSVPESAHGSVNLDNTKTETSLRERSSSEVLEKVPTVLSPTESMHPILERSSSEYITSPTDRNIWIRDTPKLQTHSEDDSDITPVISQGGFFHETSSENKKDKKTEKKKDTKHKK